MVCKNIECVNETKNNNVYCSLTCRNIFVNKHLRNYSKLKKTNLKKKERLMEIYYKSPKKCKYCDEIIIYEKRRNKYCNGSCSSSHTNIGRVHSDETRYKLSKAAINNNSISYLDKDGEKLRKRKKYYKSPKKCKHCISVIEYSKRDYIFCDKECKNKYNREKLTEYKRYKLDCKFDFNLANYIDEFNFKLVEKYGWYKAKNNGDNLNGVSRDHMYSVYEGFKNDINSRLISHPGNCELMKHEFNFKKFTGCSITIKELKQKIKKWENKHGYFYGYNFLEELENK